MIRNESTKYFYNLTPDKILEAVETLGLRCTGKMQALNSVENRVFLVEIETKGEDQDLNRVIKFYRPGRWTKEQILEEHQFICDLDASGIPVVKPLLSLTGASLQSQVDSSDQFFFSIFPQIRGRIKDEYSDDELRRLGKLIARMHLVGRQKQASARMTLSPEVFGLANLEYLLQNSILPGEIIERYKYLVQEICKVTTDWFKNFPQQRLHGDCHLGNILWRDQQITFVDFDDFLTGPQIQDLWLLTPGRDADSISKREILIDSYADMISFNKESICLLEPLRALRIINFSTWIARRWEDPAFKNLFQNFGTAQYWRDELYALEEILQIIYTGEVF